MSDAALAACPRSRIEECLFLHESALWFLGSTPPEDAELNGECIGRLGGIQSAWPIDPAAPSLGYGANTIWVVTEPGHRETTVLLPDEH